MAYPAIGEFENEASLERHVNKRYHRYNVASLKRHASRQTPQTISGLQPSAPHAITIANANNADRFIGTLRARMKRHMSLITHVQNKELSRTRATKHTLTASFHVLDTCPQQMTKNCPPVCMTSFRFGFASRLLLQSFAAGTALTLSLSTVAFAQPWRAVPGVRIRAVAAADTTAEVGDIASAVQLSGGTIVIADNINYQLHFYSAAGRFLRTIARRGEGPGEFKSVRWVGECSRDTVFAYDHMLNRITVFGTDGKVIRSFAPAVPQTGYVRCLLDGTTLYVARSAMSELSSRGVLQVSDKAGKLLYRSPEMLLDDGRPLGTSMKIAIAPEGFVYGSGDSARVMMMSLHGESPHRISAGIADRAPTDVNRDAAVEYWATFIKGTEYDYERMRGLFRKLPPVKTLPAYTDVFADVVTKAIWVRTSTFGDPSTLLERHAMDGTLQGTATLPPGLEIQQIRGDVVLAVAKDSKTGEQLLVTYRLVK